MPTFPLPPDTVARMNMFQEQTELADLVSKPPRDFTISTGEQENQATELARQS